MPPRHPPRHGGLLETRKGYNPRLLFFYFVIAGLLLILAVGLAYRQLFQTEFYSEREKVQNQRRILTPGPRGNLYDREGRLLVGNRPRFAVTLHLDELRTDFRREYLQIRRNYRESGDQDLPSNTQMERIARYAVVQRHLDLVNRIIGRAERVNDVSLHRHHLQQRLLPFTLLEDLTATEYARLIEQLPVSSPLQVYSRGVRHYPHRSSAAHALGFVGFNDDVEIDENFPGADLRTFRMVGTVGRSGLEARHDPVLQGETGGAIYLVDPAGFRIEPPLERRRPRQGGDFTTSLDLDLQLAAEKAMAATGLAGAAVALDVNTGEVLVLASKPDYDLNAFSPRLSRDAAADIESRGAWLNRASQGLYPPGSTFKLLTAIAALRHGAITHDSEIECTGLHQVAGRVFVCNNHRDRGPVGLSASLEKSCNTFYYVSGLTSGIATLSAEASRFGLDRQTGIDLPNEARLILMPSPAWKRRARGEAWFPGDTANVSIGQGDVSLTPLQMAAFIASFARGETLTPPSLTHDPNRPHLQTPPLDLSPEAYAALVAGLEAATVTGTARILSSPFLRIPGLRIAGKTGTAQKLAAGGRHLNFAWFIGYAPVDNPQIAIAVMMEGDTPGEETGGGRFAAPIAAAILKAWHTKHTTGPEPAAP